jgi:hypothetical protein
VIVVTAASSNHFGALRYMLESLRALKARVECYDLGLAPREVQALPRWAGLFYHKFDFAAYPPHLNVEIAAGEYAWKPVIVAEVVERAARERVAGRRALDRCRVVLSRARADRRAPAIRRRTVGAPVERHDGAVDAPADVRAPRRGRRGLRQLVPTRTQRSSVWRPVIASPAVRDRVYRDIVVPWRAGALDKDCIAPAGSSRRNHRQDQALLSYLVHQAGFGFADEGRQEIGVRCKCDRWFYQYIGFHVPAPVYAWCCLY